MIGKFKSQKNLIVLIGENKPKKVEELQISLRNLKNLKPKSIMVREIEGVAIFTQKLES